jgi:[ribosomal protein S5]-alanine N-acetyltransferase
MSELRLVAIDAEGNPVDPLANLSPLARDTCLAHAELYGSAGFVPPWIGYLACDGDQCVGACGFKGPPMDSRVELAYFTFPRFEGQGYASEMASQLLAIALDTQPGLRIVGQTTTGKNASTAILRKLGFRCVGTVQHPQDGAVWEWLYIG